MDINTLQIENDKYKSTVKKLVDAIKEERIMAQEDYQRLESHLLQEQQRADALESRLQNVAILIKQERDKHQIELEEAMGGGVVSNQEELDELRGIADSLSYQIEDQADQISQLTRSLQKQESALLKEKERTYELENQLSSKSDKLVLKAKELDQSNTDLEFVKTKVNKALEVIRILKTENDTLKSGGALNGELEQQLNDQSLMLKKQESQINTLVNSVQSLREENESLSQQLVDARDSVTSGQQTEDQIVNLNKMLNEHQKNERTYKDQIETLQSQVSGMNIDLEEAQKKASQTSLLTQQLDQSNTRLNRMVEAVKVEKERNEQLLNSYNELESKQNTITASVPSISIQNTGDDRLEELEREIRQLKQKLSYAEDRAEKAEERANQSQSTPSIPSPPVNSGPVAIVAPPPPGMIPPPPPPPPPPKQVTLKINRTGQSSQLQKSAPVTNEPDAQSDLIDAIKRGVKLKSTGGPESVEEKLKRQKEEREKNAPSGGMFSLGALASELAKQRAKRVQLKAQEEGLSYRKSFRLDNLLQTLDTD